MFHQKIASFFAKRHFYCALIFLAFVDCKFQFSQYSSSNNNSSPITNERLIRDAEAECDKINCFYRGPCNKDIYDRATLDKYLVDTAVGEFLEHDCFSFDKSVLLNRQVDKTKLKGLVLDDISEGRDPQTESQWTDRSFR